MLDRYIHTILSAPFQSAARLKKIKLPLNSVGFDPWGVDPKTLKSTVAFTGWFYKHYFRVHTKNIHRVPDTRAILAINHGGQIPIDGMLVFLSLLLDRSPPRLSRAQVARFVPSIPFISTLFSRCGHIVGSPETCKDLLERDECLLVFPEGLNGSGKTIFDRYKLQKFGSGFIRLAIETQTPIIPVAVIGTEESYPTLLNLKPLAKLLNLPYFPVTPLFPALGLLGTLPLPTRVTIRFGNPIVINEKPNISESKIKTINQRVKASLARELALGLKKRGNAVFTALAA